MNLQIKETETFNILDNLSCNDVTLGNFLEKWYQKYKTEINKVDLFNSVLSKKMTRKQKEFFVRTFYHVRGHFYKFLWLLGNSAPNYETKEKILHNIKEEFGGRSLSHEQLYFQFANSIGFSVSDEFLHEKHHLDFIRKYNFEHLSWLNEHNWSSKWAAFSAYEKLDNIDYSNLEALAISFGASGEGLKFFSVHNHANHFDRTYAELIEVWKKSTKIVEDAFHFIGNHQITMWQRLSEVIFRQ